MGKRALPLPPCYLHCNKHKQDMVLVKRHQMTVYRCAACVEDARAKVAAECASFHARAGYTGEFQHKPR